MIAHIDKRFGDLERFLIKQQLKDNTIVIFMTDNGGTAGVKTFNAGLREGKTTYYDGGHRVPCWIRWPAGNLGPPRDIAIPTMRLSLPSGTTKLKAWFSDAAGKDLCGAFFVTARKLP